jgi:hypothetical protein
LSCFVSAISNLGAKSVTFVEEKHEVAVILPCYNEELTVDRAIRSIVNQDFEEGFDLILSDHGSVDGTLAKLQDWERRLKDHPLIHVRVFLIKKNTIYDSVPGFNDHVNGIMARIRNDLIIVSTGDDDEYPARVRMVVNAWRETGADYITTSQRFIRDGKIVTDRNAGQTRAVALEELVKEDWDTPTLNGASSWTKKIWDRFGPLRLTPPNDLVQPFWGALGAGCFHIGLPLRRFYITGQQTGIGSQFAVEENPIRMFQLHEVMCFEHVGVTGNAMDLIEEEMRLAALSDDTKRIVWLSENYKVLSITALSRTWRWFRAREEINKRGISPIPFNM